MTPSDEARFIQLWSQGASYAALAQALGIPAGTVSSRAAALQAQGKIAKRPRGGAYPHQQAQGTPVVHPSTPVPQPTRVHPRTPTLPAPQSTPVHPGVPLPHEVAGRLLSLLPDLEMIVARERDRQQRLSTPLGTPQHTMKKTYVIESLYVDLIERYARDVGVELKDVLAQALFDFFARHHYLPAMPAHPGTPSGTPDTSTGPTTVVLSLDPVTFQAVQDCARQEGRTVSAQVVIMLRDEMGL